MMLRGLATAVRTLTVLPVPGRDAEKMTSALPWFPVVGLLLGFILYGTAVLCSGISGEKWPEGAAVLLVIAGTVLTRGLHLDGLSDWADGFWGARDRDKVLAIMKDPRIGTFGSLALACILLAKWVCFTRLIETGFPEWIVAAYVISRTMQVDLAASQPYARPEGGTGAAFVRDAAFRHIAAALAVAIITLVAVIGLHWMWVAALVMGWLVARIFGIWCRRRVGGVTGDLLGACSEIVETAALALGAVLI